MGEERIPLLSEEMQDALDILHFVEVHLPEGEGSTRSAVIRREFLDAVRHLEAAIAVTKEAENDHP